MYADDIVIFCPSAKGLPVLLNVCEDYGVEQDIQFNCKKSAVLVYRNTFVKDVIFPTYSIGGEAIKEVSHLKYLGYFLSDDMDIMRQCRQLHAQANVLARRFHMCTDSVKVALSRMYCSPVYTSQLWWSYRASSLDFA